VTGPVLSLMLAVPDATAAARWYTEALGATKLWDLGGVVGLSIEGAPFFLGEPEGNGWDTPAALGSRTVRVEIFTDDPDSFIARRGRRGGRQRRRHPRPPDALGHPPAGRLHRPVRPPLARGRPIPAQPAFLITVMNQIRPLRPFPA
jgi:catechol 2,3-dioxygenase-like lactoylglutathione lyase family enzyme